MRRTLRRRGIDTRSLYTVTRSWKGVVQSCFDWLILQRLKSWVSLIFLNFAGYMAVLLHRLPTMNNQDHLDSLLPSNWKEAQ